jgi:hypothetical protein
MAELILERILRCKFCGREMACSPLEYNQNPFCTVCLPERVRMAKPTGRIRWKTVERYAIAEVSQKRSPDARRRRRG